MLNQFLVEHCTTNNILRTGQTGAKKQSWGCTNQLLINKMIQHQKNKTKVQYQRRNLLMMWFDYKKAFDSVHRDWIIQALQIAKIPVKIINAIKNLMHLQSTTVLLLTNQYNLESDEIHFHTGVLQGDCLSLIFFYIASKPTVFSLKHTQWLPNQETRFKENKHLSFILCQ